MLGWEIFVKRGDEKVASWMTGVWGTTWLRELVKEGKAKDLGVNSGYPHAFSVKASVLLPLISKEIPEAGDGLVIGDDYVAPSGKNWDIAFDKDKLLSCSPDEDLLIEAWDQS